MVRTRGFLNFLLFLGVALLPIYVYSSGSLQPTHALLLIFSISVIMTYGFAPERWNVALMVLAAYATTIELAYVFGGAKSWSLYNPLYMTYNVFLTYSVWLYCRTNGFVYLSRGLVVAAIIALLTVGFFGVEVVESRGGTRETGGFNNPNQLGYFSVCLLSLSYLFNRHSLYSTPLTYVMYAIATMLAIMSLSKAAMTAIFIVLFIATNPRLKREFILPWLIAILLGTAIVLYMISTGAMDQYLFAQRFIEMGKENDSDIMSRGYFVFLEGNPLTAIIGLGTFKVLKTLDHEVHSTIASVFNLYGIIGGLLFVTALYIWGKAVLRNYGFFGLLCIVMPSMLYGLTHNGSRFSIFWILFAVSLVPYKEIGTVRTFFHKDPDWRPKAPRPRAVVRPGPVPSGNVSRGAQPAASLNRQR